MAEMTEQIVVERADAMPCQQQQCCDNFNDVASECSTALGCHDNVHSDTGSDHGEVETLSFFDWDDTLFPTTWLREQGLLHDDAILRSDQMELLQKLAGHAEKTLRFALQFGKVVIVTNAAKGWVEMSCAKMMPSLRSILEQVDIVSARSAFEAYTEHPSEWKRLAFEREVQLLDGSSAMQYNIISIRDSMHEQRAVKSLCEIMPNCFGKSMKFFETPSIEQLIDQHEFVMSCFLDVAEHIGNLDVEIAL